MMIRLPYISKCVYYCLVSAYMTASIYKCVHLYTVVVPSIGVYIDFYLIAKLLYYGGHASGAYSCKGNNFEQAIIRKAKQSLIHNTIKCINIKITHL